MPVTDSLMAAACGMPSVVVSGREPDLANVDVVSGDDGRRGVGGRAPGRTRPHPHRTSGAAPAAPRELRTEGYRAECTAMASTITSVSRSAIAARPAMFVRAQALLRTGTAADRDSGQQRLRGLDRHVTRAVDGPVSAGGPQRGRL